MTEDHTAELTEWAHLVVSELGLTGLVVDVEAVLDVASTAAHSVRRPAAPLTTYLVGVRVGQALAAGADAREAAVDASERVAALATAYAERERQRPGPPGAP